MAVKLCQENREPEVVVKETAEKAEVDLAV